MKFNKIGLTDFRNEKLTDSPEAHRIFATVVNSPRDEDREIMVGVVTRRPDDGWKIEPDNSDDSVSFVGWDDFPAFIGADIQKLMASMERAARGTSIGVIPANNLDDDLMSAHTDMAVCNLGVLAGHTDSQGGFLKGVGTALAEFMVREFEADRLDKVRSMFIDAFNESVRLERERSDKKAAAVAGIREILTKKGGKAIAEILRTLNPRTPDDESAGGKP